MAVGHIATEGATLPLLPLMVFNAVPLRGHGVQGTPSLTPAATRRSTQAIAQMGD